MNRDDVVEDAKRAAMSVRFDEGQFVRVTERNGRAIWSKVDDAMKNLTEENSEGLLYHVRSVFVPHGGTNPLASLQTDAPEAQAEGLEAAIEAACEAKCKQDGFSFDLLKNGQGIGAEVMRKNMRPVVLAALTALSRNHDEALDGAAKVAEQKWRGMRGDSRAHDIRAAYAGIIAKEIRALKGDRQ